MNMSETKTDAERTNPKPEIPALQQPPGQRNSSGNREYKSRLFSFIFGREENKAWTLSLYNALHGTSHDDPSAITINTIEDVIYMGMKNDLSILVSEIISFYRSMALYEQQSSYNPNMPIREFMYAGKLYDKFIHSARLNRYGKTLLPLPLPKLVVFYNGEDDAEDETTLCLSDAFREEIRRNLLRRYEKEGAMPGGDEIAAETERILEEASPDIEVKVRMVNINYGHNKKLLSACKPLQEYAWFVAQVRKNLASPAENGAAKLSIGEAIDLALDVIPQDFVIREFLLSNKAEVKDMCLTEYNEMETMEILRQEALLEGMQKGRKEGLLEGKQAGLLEGKQAGLLEGKQAGLLEGKRKTMLLVIQNLMDNLGLTADKSMDVLNIPPAERTFLHTCLSEKRMPGE